MENKAHIALFEYMKYLYDNNLQFDKEGLLLIYNGYVNPEKRITDSERLTEEQIYNNASGWLNSAISKLVRKGYLGLTFKRESRVAEGFSCLT